jgi:hypothetical protein
MPAKGDEESEMLRSACGLPWKLTNPTCPAIWQRDYTKTKICQLFTYIKIPLNPPFLKGGYFLKLLNYLLTQLLIEGSSLMVREVFPHQFFDQLIPFKVEFL